MKILALSLVFTAFVATASAATNNVFCYYGSWSHYRPGNGKVSVDHLNPNLCTHIVYTFVGISTEGEVRILDSWLDIDLKALEKLVDLKKINPKLKVLVAVGGWNEGSSKYSTVMANPGLRAKFIRSVVEFVKKFNLDGFDLDWEYPNQRGGKPEDKANFALLCKELRAAFDEHNYILSAAVGASKHHRDASYDVPAMSQYLHFINIMAYDLHWFGEGKTGLNAPLYGSEFDESPELNVNDIVEGWIKDGAAPEKLLLGVGFYGRSFALQDPSNNGVGAPTNGPAQAGEFTREAGTLSYAEICMNIKNKGWTSKWEEKQQVPYAFHGNQWVGYDDVKSLKLKVDLAQKWKLAGIMLWSIEQDDIRNLCGDGHYPLLNAINRFLGNSVQEEGYVPPSTEASTTTQRPNPNPSNPNTPGANGDGGCNGENIVADPTDCSVFFMCDSAGTKTRFSCAAGTLFDKQTKTCVFAQDVSC